MRIIIADDQRKVRYALRVLLEKQPDVDVVGETNNYSDLAELIDESHPDVLIVDWLLSEFVNRELVISCREKCPQISIIAMSGRPEYEQAAIDAGANAFISKIDPPDRLLAALGDIRRDLEQLPK